MQAHALFLSRGEIVKPISQWTGSQKLTAGVAILYAGAMTVHFKEGRVGMGVLFASWVLGNSALVYMEGV